MPSAELPFEFMLNALRLHDGFEASLFSSATGLPAGCIDGVVAAAVADGLLRRDGDRMAPTTLGRRFLNDLTARFLPA